MFQAALFAIEQLFMEENISLPLFVSTSTNMIKSKNWNVIIY